MAIPEDQLDTWAKQGSVTQSAQTYNTIKSVLDDASAPYHSRSYSIFLQGSYGNDTNVYRESDVDIVVRLNQTYYADTGRLSVGAQANYDKRSFVLKCPGAISGPRYSRGSRRSTARTQSREKKRSSSRETATGATQT